MLMNELRRVDIRLTAGRFGPLTKKIVLDHTESATVVSLEPAAEEELTSEVLQSYYCPKSCLALSCCRSPRSPSPQPA